MDEETRETVEAITKDWNLLVQNLLDAREIWNKTASLLVENRGLEVYLPLSAQRVFARVSKHARFDVMLERFVTLWVTQGGLEAFLVEEDKVNEIASPMEEETETVLEEGDE